MKTLLTLLFCLLPLASFAVPTTEQVNDVLRWRVIQITGKDNTGLFSIDWDKNGTRWSWSLTNALPNAAYIEANAATAKAYLADYDKTEKAALKEVTPEVLRAILAVLVEENNELRVKVGLPPRTEDHVRKAIQKKLPQ